MTRKSINRTEELEVLYNDEHWERLQSLRKNAMKIMEALGQAHIFSVVHGSIARGDVSTNSDIDVFIPQIVPSFSIEMALTQGKITSYRRFIIQATPTYSLKGYIEIDEQRSVSFPLARLRRTEREFYSFGGKSTLVLLKNGVRSLGIDKRLMLIKPRFYGHIEISISGQEETVAHLLGISVETVLERVRILTRRDKVGRTGLFIKKELSTNETFELALKRITDEKPSVRRRLRTV
jgi:predicted nucleotidyltransferase